MTRFVCSNSSASFEERKKIVWLCSLVFGFDMVVSQEEMAKRLSDCIGEVTLFAVSQEANRKDESKAHFILLPMRFVPIITHLLFSLALAVCLPFYVLVRKPNYIITDKDTAIFGAVLKILVKQKCKVILDIRTTPLKGITKFYDKYDSFSFAVAIAIARKVFDGITIVSEHMKKEVCYRFGLNTNSVSVWTSGVSLQLFDPKNFSKQETRKALDLVDKFVIFYHGSMGMNRGLIEVIKSIEGLRKTIQQLRLFILGDAPILPILKDLVKEIGIQDTVVFHQKVPYWEVPRYISAADVGVVPLPNIENWRNQSPLKLLEYLAMKKVVVLTDIPANREIVGDCRCGIYVSSSTPDQIAKGFVYAFEHREKLDAWGDQGREIVEKEYSWHGIAEKLSRYLRSLDSEPPTLFTRE